MNFGDHFSFIGGSFTLKPGNLQKAIKITEKELEQFQNRLALWEANPGHHSFAHDMEQHGSEIIDKLLRGHVKAANQQLQALKRLQ